MTIPKNITKDHVIQAFDYIDEHGTPEERKATKYYVENNGRVYSPKYVISVANFYANGKELPPSDFSGGNETNSFLMGLGFIIKENRKEIIDFPSLQSKDRSREYELYNDEIRDKVILEYLFNSKSHRWIDENVIGLSSEYSKGYQAMGILHYIGLKDLHKGIFKNFDIEEALNALENIPESSRLSLLKESLYRLSGGKNTDRELEDTILQDIESEEADEYEPRIEGATKYFFGKRYERDPINRKKAIEIHGCKCFVCGFDFEEVYGDWGKDYIEIHHIKPISSAGEQAVNPETDLIPLCSNCHRMIHRKKDKVLSIHELKSFLKIKYSNCIKVW